MRIAKLCSCLGCLLFVFSACTGKTVSIKLEDHKYRVRYIQVLDKKGLAYDVKPSGEIVINIRSVEELDRQMAEYYEYVQDDIRRQNEALR